MNKPIIKDQFLLKRISLYATKKDQQTIDDLKDTLMAHPDCLGLAANMIGVSKRIMAVRQNGKPLIIINPKIIAKEKLYTTKEGCLSLPGMRETARYTTIKITYLNERFKKKTATFTGLTAQIIQHECDHFEGILI